MNTFLILRCRRTAYVAALAFAVTLTLIPSRADVVFEWNEALVSFTRTVPVLPPLLEARTLAMAHLAMDEAVVDAARNTRPEQLLMVQRVASAAAAHTILVQLIPEGKQTFDPLMAAQLAAIRDAAQRERAARIGRAAAALVLSRRDRDGWCELARLHPPNGPAPDNSAQAAAALTAGERSPKSPWLSAKPFILKSAKQMVAAPPFTLDRAGTVQVDFTLRNARIFTGVDREAAAVALDRNWSGAPLATWNRIARTAAADASLDLAGEARLLAVVNLALADALLSAFHWRHELGSWQLTTVAEVMSLHGLEPASTDEVVWVDNGLEHELAKREIRSVLLPPIRDFPSPRAALAGAAQAAIAGVLRNVDSPLALPEEGTVKRVGFAEPPRVVASLSAAARECVFVASLDGRHTRESCVSGYELGEHVGAYIARQTGRRR